MENNDSLRLIVLKSAEELGYEVNEKIKRLRNSDKDVIVKLDNPRFNNGESKAILQETVREKDTFILADIQNHLVSYNYYGENHFMSPDEHYRDIVRVISAMQGHAKKISVVTPLLYQSRQHKGKERESLDAAVALRELEDKRVKRIITYDVHNEGVRNAIPFTEFKNIYASNPIVNDFIDNEDIDYRKILVISPDEGAVTRSRVYADLFRAQLGLFLKRRDYSIFVDGKHPIVGHTYTGPRVKNKNVIIIDDMIASGGSIIDTAEKMKQKGAAKVYAIATFSLFTLGSKMFDEAYEKGIIDKIYTSNLTAIDPEIKNKPWLRCVNCSEQLAAYIDHFNHDKSLDELNSDDPSIGRKLEYKIKR